MKEPEKRAFAALLLALADDELILAHRNSEWTGHAPILEEDIAFANIALDEMGHAVWWYIKLSEVLGEDPETYPDQLVFFREPSEFRNVRMVELPNGDWAFSMLRQYLFDSAELVRLNALRASEHPVLAEMAAKLLPEERFHHRHTSAWVERLGLGTEESQARLQLALDSLYPAAQQLFRPVEGEEWLRALEYVPSGSDLLQAWKGQVDGHLSQAGLQIPDGPEPALDSRHQHSEHLASLLAEMQQVARAEAGAAW